jgi:predicted DNA-binding transcriptional regulator AlpA
MKEPLFIGINDACRRYGIGRTTLYSLFQLDGCPPVMKLGGKTLLDLAAMDAFVRSQLRPSVIEQNKSA